MSDKNNHQGESHKDPKHNSHEESIERHLAKINLEFRQGFELIHKHPRSVTIFGSSLANETNPNYDKAREISRRIAKELNYTVITGGGPGIMEAANRGAAEAGGASIGLSINLPHEHPVNEYSVNTSHFKYFFVRKAILTFAAEAYIFFPGGYGTFDELFSILTLIQTNKIPRVPIILYDSTFWNKFHNFLEDTMCNEYKTINQRDIKLFEITDSFDDIIEKIRTSPVSEWWRGLN